MRHKREKSSTPDALPYVLEIYHKNPASQTRRTLVIWNGPANDATLNDWITGYGRLIMPPGRLRRVFDELGYAPLPESARITRAGQIHAIWPSNIESIR